MVSPLKFALGFALFLITIVVGELLVFNNEDKSVNGSHSKPSKSAHWISSELVIVAIFVLSLAIILLVPAIKGEIFVEWTALELPNVARLVAAFSFNFFPGYIILAIVGKHELGKLPKLIASYFLSFFMLTITAFVSARIVGVVDEFFLDSFFFMCTALIVFYLLTRLLREKPKLENKNISSSSNGFRKMLPALLVGLTAAFMGIWLLWMYSKIGFFIGAEGTDMWRIHGTAQDFLDYKAFKLLQFPWWLNLYLAGFTVLSGAPLANAYLTLYPFIVLAMLSFYVMSSVFLKNKRMASLATLSYAIFAGPVWLYALYLRNFSPIIGYDEWKLILYEASEKFLLQGRYPPFVVGLNGAVIAYVSLWWLMYATWQLDLRRKFNLFLMSITLAIGYMVHGIDPIIFVVYLIALLVVFSLTRNNEGRERVRRAAWSVLFGIGIVALLDVSLTSEYDYFNSVSPNALASRYFYFNSPSFYVLAFTSALIIALTHDKFIKNKSMQFCDSVYKRLSPKNVDSLKRRLPEIIFYLYGVSLIVFLLLLPSLSIATTLLGWVPWYVYLIVGGVPSFLGLVGVAIVLRKWNKLDTRVREVLLFCALSFILLFIFGQTVSFINENFFYTRFWERRTFVYIHPMVSIPMAYAVVTISGRIHPKEPRNVKHLGRIGIVSLLTSLIILSSVSSALIAGDFAQVGYFVAVPTKEELEALNFLHYSLPKGFKTAYINRQTKEYIRAFANDKYTNDPHLWLGQFYYSPESLILAINSSDSRFLYLNRIRDSPDLRRNIFLQQLIKVLPVEFNNSEVTIYSFPPLQLPSKFSFLGVVSPEETKGAVYGAYVLWFWTLVMSKYSYSVITNTSDTVALDYAETIIISYDPSQRKEDVGQLVEWVSNGGHLVVSNTKEFGMFAESFGLKTKVSLVNCDSTENWRTAYARGEISVENTVKIEGTASLRLQNNFVSWEGWIYEPPEAWNLSRYEYLGIWVYINPEWVNDTGGGPIWYLYLTDSDGSASYYRYDLSVFDSKTKTFVPSFTGWKLLLIPIKESYGHLNLSNITKLHIDTGYQLPVNILIDEIFVIEESEERSVVLADGIDGAVSIDLPTIEVEGLGFSVDARIIANYTKNDVPIAPFALQKDFGSGKVTYLNANLLYEFILSESSGLKSPYEVLMKILEMIGIKE